MRDSDEIQPFRSRQDGDQTTESSTDTLPKASPPVVYVVDDDPDVLVSIEQILATENLRTESFQDGQQFLKRVAPDELGCLITDLRMPNISGTEILKTLKTRGCLLSVIVVTAFADVPVTVELMKIGAVAVIEKPFTVERLCSETLSAIKQSYAKSGRQKRVAEARKKLARLSSEELSVLDFASRGIPNRQIGVELSLSNRTIDRRRQSAMQKLGVESIADFAVLRTLAET